MYNRNKAELIGFLAEKPTIGTTGGGIKFARLRIVTNRSWKDRDTGDWKEASEGHRVATFDPYIVERCEKLDKGAYVLVGGELRNSKRDVNGETQYFYGIFLPNKVGELRVLDRPKRNEQGGGSETGGGYDNNGGGSYDQDDEIPF